MGFSGRVIPSEANILSSLIICCSEEMSIVLYITLTLEANVFKSAVKYWCIGIYKTHHSQRRVFVVRREFVEIFL